MGIPIDIYYLVRFENSSAGCTHHLLLKVTRAEYVNSNEDQCVAVIDDVVRRRDLLIEWYRSQLLASNCHATHTCEIVGELQGDPIGEVFYERVDEATLIIWIALTQYGDYWIVFGAADTEEEFWRQIADYDELTSLGPKAPARCLQVHYLNRAERSH